MNVTLKLDDNQSRKLHLVADIKDISIADYVNSIVAEHIDNVQVADIVAELETLFKSDEVVEKKAKKNHDSNELFVVPKTFRKLYKGDISLKRCAIITHGKSKNIELKCDINTAMYLHEKGDLTYGEFKSICDTLKLRPNVLYRFVYNVQTHTFDKIMGDFDNKIRKTNFSFGKMNGKVYCNKEKMCDVQSLQVLIHQYANSSTPKEETIWRFIQSNPHMDALHIRIICENFDNPSLTRFFTKKETPVVNNREKRQNLIMNGGI